MSQSYDIYGIGNALVDMEFAVPDDFIARHGLEKGHMTLVTADTQARLTGELSEHEPARASGGSAANTCIAAAAFGSRAFYSCKVADDAVGHFFVHDLQEAGVDTNALRTRGAGVSGQCLVMITPDAERTMNTFLGISETLSEADLDEAAIGASRYLYMEGYLCSSPTARAAVVKARDIAARHGVQIVATLSDPSMVAYFRQDLGEMIGPRVDHLFCNEEEALDWTTTTAIDDAAEALKALAGSFCITRGAAGSLVWDGTSLTSVDAQPVSAVDTTGAGDIYAGAYLHGLANGFDHPRAARLASRAAARLVQQMGPRLPLAEHPPLLRED